MLREYLPFWARLTEGQQRRLEEGAAVRRFARGEMVYGGGTECAGLILPTEGQLRAYMLTDEGRELTLYRLFPRDMCLFSASCVCGASSSTCWWRRSGIPRPFFCRRRCIKG